MFLIFRELISHKFNPCRTAGSQKRKLLASFQAVQELRRFFHNSHIGTECSIIYFIKSNTVKDIDDLAHDTLTLWQTKGASHCHTDSRCHLCDNSDIRISQSFPYCLSVVTDTDCSGRTEDLTLTTVYAVCRSDLFVKCRHNHSF